MSASNVGLAPFEIDVFFEIDAFDAGGWCSSTKAAVLAPNVDTWPK